MTARIAPSLVGQTARARGSGSAVKAERKAAARARAARTKVAISELFHSSPVKTPQAGTQHARKDACSA